MNKKGSYFFPLFFTFVGLCIILIETGIIGIGGFSPIKIGGFTFEAIYLGIIFLIGGLIWWMMKGTKSEYGRR